MIIEDYVSFETAKLLKEKGFDEICYLGYNKNGEYVPTSNRTNSQIIQPDFCFICCPTLQMVMKWLREIYKFEIRSIYDYDKDSWWGNINPMYEETVENSNVYQKALRFDYQGKSYEESCETAIKYCLENLI